MVSDEPIRFYHLARLHGLDSRELLENCHRAGILVMHQLSSPRTQPSAELSKPSIRRGGGGPSSSNDGPASTPVPPGTGPKPRTLEAAARPEPKSTDDMK